MCIFYRGTGQNAICGGCQKQLLPTQPCTFTFQTRNACDYVNLLSTSLLFTSLCHPWKRSMNEYSQLKGKTCAWIHICLGTPLHSTRRFPILLHMMENPTHFANRFFKESNSAALLGSWAWLVCCIQNSAHKSVCSI